jgi:glucose-1-phosphate thymidylyltransferase
MSKIYKIVVPMAGWGTRMRPHTWSKPKPLIALAGKTVLDYVVAQFDSLTSSAETEFVFIVGPQGPQIEEYMRQNYPQFKCHFVLQEQMKGQSDAILLAHEFLSGPMLMAFSDTLIETDLKFLKNETYDAIAWVKPVPDPRRFGVAEVNPQGQVTHLVEKPQDIKNNLALVGFYYFRSGEILIEAIQEQIRRGVSLKGEYFLADAVNMLLEKGASMRTEQVETWLDAGTPDSVLETNRYLLEHGSATSGLNLPGVAIIPPVFIHPSAQVTQTVIGPHVSIGADCKLNNVVIRNSILDAGSQVENMIIEGSLMGRQVQVTGKTSILNLGDNTILK